MNETGVTESISRAGLLSNSENIQLTANIQPTAASKTSFENFEEFAEISGLITCPEELEKTGVGKFARIEENGSFDTGELRRLQQFCSLNPGYHLATATTDGLESELCEEVAVLKGLVWDEMTEDEQEAFREKHEISIYTIDNRVRIVDRLCYYLCRGDSNPEIYLSEKEFVL